MENIEKEIKIIDKASIAKRIDIFVTEILEKYTRNQIIKWIISGHILIKGNSIKPAYKLKINDIININIPLEGDNKYSPNKDIKIKNMVIYEDSDILIINKPNNIVVHPGHGNWNNTLLNGLLYYYEELKLLPRCGIIHRLDKNTSGILVIAKNFLSYTVLLKKMKKREIKREYIAISWGNLQKSGTINRPLGRNPSSRTKITVLEAGKIAITHYNTIKTFDNICSILKIVLETGRTHQIRVHFHNNKTPIVGDQTYGKKNRSIHSSKINIFERILLEAKRQMLHASKISFIHPVSNTKVTFVSKVPDDMKKIIKILMEMS